MSTYPEIAGAKEETTSRAAATAIEASGRAWTLRKLARAMFELGWEGTADELAERLVQAPLAVRPRVSELRKLGLIEPTGERRRSLAGGASSHVWRRKA